MMPVVLLPYLINFAGLIYLIPTIILTIYYNYICYELLNFKKNKFDTKKSKKSFYIFNFLLIHYFCLITSR